MPPRLCLERMALGLHCISLERWDEMIVDSNFIVFKIIINGELVAYEPSRAAIEAKIGTFAYNNPQEHYEKTGESYSFEPVRIKGTRDLEDLLEDDIDDDTFERWERASLKNEVL